MCLAKEAWVAKLWIPTAIAHTEIKQTNQFMDEYVNMKSKTTINATINV